MHQPEVACLGQATIALCAEVPMLFSSHQVDGLAEVLEDVKLRAPARRSSPRRGAYVGRQSCRPTLRLGEASR
jgi:hypothetical protein